MNTLDEMKRMVEKHDVVVFDIETNGFETDTAILEIAAVKYCAGTLFDSSINRQELNHLIYFDGVPNPSAFSVHNLSVNSLKEQGKPMDLVMATFAQFCEKSLLAGHNIIDFDLRLVNYQLAKYGIPLEGVGIIDTLLLSRRMLSLPSYRLGAVVQHFGITAKPTHRALDDVKATGEVLKNLLS